MFFILLLKNFIFFFLLLHPFERSHMNGKTAKIPAKRNWHMRRWQAACRNNGVRTTIVLWSEKKLVLRLNTGKARQTVTASAMRLQDGRTRTGVERATQDLYEWQPRLRWPVVCGSRSRFLVDSVQWFPPSPVQPPAAFN